MRQTAELENQMTSVERILEYADLPSEPPLETEQKNLPPNGWPTDGHIAFKSLSLRYVENSSRVLRNLTFSIGAKVICTIFEHLKSSETHVLNEFFFLGKNWHCWTYWCWKKLYYPSGVPFGQ